MGIAIDPILYLAFAVGAIGGRIYPIRPRWLDRATLGCVLLLIALLGDELGTTAPQLLLEAVPVALGSVALVLAVTVAIAWALRKRTRPSLVPTPARSARPWLGLLFLGDVVAGFAIGHFTAAIGSWALQLSLYALLVLVAWGLRWTFARLDRLWVPLTAAVSGALVGAVGLVLLAHEYGPIALATTFGFGFYTLAGPLVAYRAGASLGFIAFLSNFLRENLTMLLSPWLGRHLHGEGLAAMGGATSMDTTLFFITRFGDPEAGALAVMTGLVLTVVATVALPLFLSIPGG